jgi:hypothetical protein
MVNENMVNADLACSELAEICEKFSVSGSFLAFKNTVKYICRFFVNARNT